MERPARSRARAQRRKLELDFSISQEAIRLSISPSLIAIDRTFFHLQWPSAASGGGGNEKETRRSGKERAHYSSGARIMCHEMRRVIDLSLAPLELVAHLRGRL